MTSESTPTEPERPGAWYRDIAAIYTDHANAEGLSEHARTANLTEAARYNRIADDVDARLAPTVAPSGDVAERLRAIGAIRVSADGSEGLEWVSAPAQVVADAVAAIASDAEGRLAAVRDLCERAVYADFAEVPAEDSRETDNDVVLAVRASDLRAAIDGPRA